MPESRKPLLSKRAERLFALEQLHEISVVDRDERWAMTTGAEIVEVREVPIQSNRLLNSLVLTSVGLVEAAWLTSLVYLAARLLL